MGKLNQVIAVASGKKTQCQKAITGVYHKLQKDALLKGIARTYRPKDEDGDKLPAEANGVQYHAEEALHEAALALSELFDVIATQEYANCLAKADVCVDGKLVLTGVPVSYLLFLDKQLVDIHTLVEKLPTLDPGQDWSFNQATNSWATKPAETVRTKKVPKNHVMSEATKEHPAQVQVFTEDIVVGYWTTTNFSGAVPESSKASVLLKVRKLQEAVKRAREEANSLAVTEQQIGKPVFAYLFGN